MSLFSHKCPHCKTVDVQFQSVADVCIKLNFYSLFMACNHCKMGIVITVRVMMDDALAKLGIPTATPHRFDGTIGLKTIYQVENVFPTVAELSAPEFVSKKVGSYFLQAVDNMQRDNYDAAGVMFRKTLDVATKELKAKDGSLKKRIEELAEKHEITPAMQEWAHAIRLDGNEAAHEEEPFDKETCEALRSFTELFLMYAFTLPEMLKARRAKKSG